MKKEVIYYIRGVALWLYFGRFFIDTLEWLPVTFNVLDELFFGIGILLMILGGTRQFHNGRELGTFILVVILSSFLQSITPYATIRFLISFLKTLPVFYLIVNSSLSVSELKGIIRLWLVAVLAQIPMVLHQQRVFFLTAAIAEPDAGQGFLGLNAAHDVGALMLLVICFHFVWGKQSASWRKKGWILLLAGLTMFLTSANHVYVLFLLSAIIMLSLLTLENASIRSLFKLAVKTGPIVAIGIWLLMSLDLEFARRIEVLPSVEFLGKAQAWMELQSVVVAPLQILFGMGPASFSTAVALDLRSSFLFDQIVSIYLDLAAQRGGSVLDIPFATSISLLAEVGVVGLLAFVLLYGRVFLRIRAMGKFFRADAFWYASYVMLHVIVVIFGGLFFLTNFAENPFLTLPFWLVGGCLLRYGKLQRAMAVA